MIDGPGTTNCRRNCWYIGAAAGLLLAVGLWVWPGWGVTGGLLFGIALAVALGYILSSILCGDAAASVAPRAAFAPPPMPAPVPPPVPPVPEPVAKAVAVPAAAAPAPAAEPAPVAEAAPSAPAPAAATPAEAAPAPAPAGATRPALLPVAREGGADDLKKIKGVGPKLEALLHRMGVFHFDQIAHWTAEEVAWVDAHLEGFSGRVSRDDWVAQARILAHGGSTAFADRVTKGDVY